MKSRRFQYSKETQLRQASEAIFINYEYSLFLIPAQEQIGH